MIRPLSTGLIAILVFGCARRSPDLTDRASPPNGVDPSRPFSITVPAGKPVTTMSEVTTAVESSPEVTATDVTVPRVLLVSLDGLRPDAIDAQTAPTLQSLIDGGSYQPAALAEIPAVTLPNHASMVTGLSIPSHGVYFNETVAGRIDKPTIFDVARDYGVPVGFFAGKTKLGYLCEPQEATDWHIEGDVDALADHCAEAIRTLDLQLIFLHFRQPDSTGHAEGWMTEPYLAAVHRTDAAFARVLAALDDTDRRVETLIIVTADHGGHDKIHGLPIPEDQHVPFILNGPDIAAGRTLTGIVRPMDAAATALAALGLPTEIARDGMVIGEARTDYSPPRLTSDPAVIFSMPCGPVPGVFVVLTLMGMCGWRSGRTARRRIVE